MGHPTYVAAKRTADFARRAARKLLPFLKPQGSVMPEVPAVVPKILWINWNQGHSAAPAIVQACRKTWQELNPNWDIRLLDRTNAGQYVDLPPLPNSISDAHRSDVLRTRLLAEYGGVWADATTWCLKSLDEWLPMVAHAGFFVFNWDNGDKRMIAAGLPRLVGNWFIAAAPRNPLVMEWDRLACEYWAGRQSTSDYFWHNDALEYALRSHEPSRRVWGRMPKFSAGPPHFAWLALERGEAFATARQAIATCTTPLQKLSWRISCELDEIQALLGVGEGETS